MSSTNTALRHEIDWLKNRVSSLETKVKALESKKADKPVFLKNDNVGTDHKGDAVWPFVGAR